MCDSDTALILISIETLISGISVSSIIYLVSTEVEMLQLLRILQTLEVRWYIALSQVCWDTFIRINNSCPIKSQQFIITSPADLNLARVIQLSYRTEKVFQNPVFKTLPEKHNIPTCILSLLSALFNQRIKIRIILTLFKVPLQWYIYNHFLWLKNKCSSFLEEDNFFSWQRSI